MTEPEPGRYALTGLGALLSTEHDDLGIRPILDVDHVLGRTEMSMTSLLHTVRTGASAHEGAYGSSVWEYLDGPRSSAADLAVFAQASTAFDAELVVDGYHWSDVGSVVDVGGSTGALLARLLLAHPHLSGTLLDLPAFAESGRANLAAAGVADRSTVVGGSFFDPLPPGADVYLLSGIPPDWDDDSAVRLLRRCGEAAGDRGRVLLAEVHLRAEHPDRADRTALDLRIEASMENPNRTTAEVAALGAAAGLAVTAAGPSTRSRSLLELRPAAVAGPVPQPASRIPVR